MSHDRTELERRLEAEFDERERHLMDAVEDLRAARLMGCEKAYQAGQWLEVNARQLATLAESIARERNGKG